jgi:transposase
MLESDSNILGDLYKTCKDSKEKIRYEALYAVSRGNDVKTVANIIAVEESTIYDWIKKWELEESVADKPRSGMPKSITKDDEEEIKRLIDENEPKKYGINASSYTTKELQFYFMKYGGKSPSFLLLLHKIEKQYVGERVLVIMDNSKVYHDKRVDRFFRERENMKPLYQTPCSPEINPEEYVHRYFRNKLLNNCKFKSIKQIGSVISYFAKSITQETIRSIVPMEPLEALLSG